MGAGASVEQSPDVSPEPPAHGSEQSFAESGFFLVTSTTGEQRGSGTDQDVFIVIRGEQGSSAEYKLDNFWRDDFQLGKTDSFTIGAEGASPVGDVVAVDLRTQGGGDLYLTKVTVQCLASDKKEVVGPVWVFPVHTWLVSKVQEKLVVSDSRSLLPQGCQAGTTRAAVRQEQLEEKRRAYDFTHEHRALGDLSGKFTAFIRLPLPTNETRTTMDDQSKDFNGDMLKLMLSTYLKYAYDKIIAHTVPDVDTIETLDEWITTTYGRPDEIDAISGGIGGGDMRRAPDPSQWSEWRTDEYFGRMTLQGHHPLWISAVTSTAEEAASVIGDSTLHPEGSPLPCAAPLPEEFLVAKHPELLDGVLPEGRTLAGEIEAGHCFLLDYSVIAEGGFDHEYEYKSDSLVNAIALDLDNSEGRDLRYVCAPFVLLHADADAGLPLRPIAIQLERKALPEFADRGPPVFTPRDSVEDWLAAKIFVMSADFACHQFISHALGAHLTQEPAAIAVQRNLAPSHPLHKLLRPHLTGLIWVNEYARGTLVNTTDPDGLFRTIKDFDARVKLGSLMAMKADGSARFAVFAYSFYSAHRTWLPNDLRARGFLASDGKSRTKWWHALGGDYCYAEDALPLHAAVSEYSRGIVDTYYTADADVQADVEVGSMIAELTAPDRGNLKGVPSDTAHTKAGIAALAANIIFQAAGIHSAVNFSQIDIPTNVAFSPGLLRTPPPREKGLMTEKRLVEMMPPRKWALVQIMTLMLLSQPSAYKLGQFGVETEWIRNNRAWGHIVRFREALRECGEEVDRRNKEVRKFKYEYLHPDNCPPSTAI